MRRALLTIIQAFVAIAFLLVADTQAHPSWGIAVDHQGQVYFSDLKTVWKIDARGGLSVFRGSADRHTHELNVDEAGNVYGADNSYEPSTERFFSAIWKMTPAGSFSYLLSSTDDPPEGISIWRDRDGNTYHATNHPGVELLVLKRSVDGRVTVLAGNSQAASVYRQGVPYSLGGMAFGPEGALYFVHGSNVSKVTGQGVVNALARNLTIEKASDARTGAGGGAAAAAASPTQLFGIAVDARGSVFVADYGNRRVLKISPEGQTSTVLRAEESWFPTGVAARGSDLYVLEMGETPSRVSLGARVRKLLPDGKVLTLANTGEAGTSKANPSTGESSSGAGSNGQAGPGQQIPYAVIGAALTIFALIILGWLVWRRIYARQHGST